MCRGGMRYDWDSFCCCSESLADGRGFYKATTVMMMMIMAGQRIEYSECLAGW